jgi:hypothetical protein
MKKIGIEINGVLRDTIGKFTELYEKHFLKKRSGVLTTFQLFNDDHFAQEQCLVRELSSLK